MIENRAIIEKGATIGEGSTIGAYSFIGKHVAIGKHNTIGTHVVIDGHTTIGDNNSIDTHTVLGTVPQDIRSSTAQVALWIGNGNQIGSRVFITAGTVHGGGATVLGDNNQLQDGVHIGHDVQMGNHCVMQEDAALGGHVIVGEHVIFGKDASVHQFVEIGNFASLADGAALTQDLPPYCTAEGNRAKITGLHRVSLDRYFSDTEVTDIKKSYTQLFAGVSPKGQALSALETQQPAVCNILYRFIADSKRGIPFKRKNNAK